MPVFKRRAVGSIAFNQILLYCRGHVDRSKRFSCVSECVAGIPGSGGPSMLYISSTWDCEQRHQFAFSIDDKAGCNCAFDGVA